ncbi:low affinity immunoglobulin gamma Fc region receptor III-like [Archocentrus centrarchus]|uniref:low affinity immunoglobulin gamma Fc region receptor III-like n=1 Tax=Archocentrus centrarchus TaxID=63155 RepID=UPI0011E9DEA2|nr:low affinity immunoglobulin gamma Fc region receptor III-like [Archocentrus centrarchus]
MASSSPPVPPGMDDVLGAASPDLPGFMLSSSADEAEMGADSHAGGGLLLMEFSPLRPQSYVCSAASLTVSPHIVQEVNDDSVKLTCEGKSTFWKVRKFPEKDTPYCAKWWRSGESICKISTIYSDDGVYWCESISGEFSNAVNITLQDYYSGPILLSPIDPVNEGTFVSIRCNLRRKKILPNVVFYHNDKLVQNDTREELNILAVSKSDEGFYKCLYSGRESPSRWVSVKPALGPESSSSHVSARMKVMTTVVFILPVQRNLETGVEGAREQQQSE